MKKTSLILPVCIPFGLESGISLGHAELVYHLLVLMLSLVVLKSIFTSNR